MSTPTHLRPEPSPAYAVWCGVAVVVALAAAAVVLVTLRARADGAGPVTAGDHALVADRDAVRAAGLLAVWDRHRSAAWADADPRALAALYAPGSPAGASDTAMLRRWTERGLRVEGLRTQVLSVRVRSRTADRWELDVVDRVVGGRVVAAVAGPSGGRGAGRPLPADLPSRSRVVLVDAGASRGWVVTSSEPLDEPVSGPAPSAAPP